MKNRWFFHCAKDGGMLRKFLFGILLSVLMYCAPFVANAVTCPDGYSVIDDSGLCKVECPDGWYVKNAGEPCAQITGSTPYYVAKHTVVYGETSGNNVKKCPSPDMEKNDVIANPTMMIPETLDHSSINQCILSRLRVRYTTEEGYSPSQISHGVLLAPCYYTTGDDGNAIYDDRRKDPVTGETRMGCVGGSAVISCDAGYYAHCTSTGNGPYDMGCQPVGYNYYSPDGDLTRYPCPAGTMTCGYGDCADSIEDCVPYKTLHVGNDVSLVMATEKYVSPSLAIMDDDNVVYYAQTTNKKIPGMHVRLLGTDNIEYTVINPLEQFGTTVRKHGTTYVHCENGETTYTHIDIP